ncbi:MAG: hypothetical protein ACLP22_23735, partial [Solirubrobacteraceae bacterium]
MSTPVRRIASRSRPVGSGRWATESRESAGVRLLSATFAHDEQGVRSLCRQLVGLEVELVAIERPDGLLV